MAVSDADCHLTFLQWDSASRNVGKNIFRFMKPQSARLAAPASGAFRPFSPKRVTRLLRFAIPEWASFTLLAD